MEEMNVEDLPEGPTAADALTVDEAIARLEAIRARHGGHVRLHLCDSEPVVQVVYNLGVVIVNDHFWPEDQSGVVAAGLQQT